MSKIVLKTKTHPNKCVCVRQTGSIGGIGSNYKLTHIRSHCNGQ